MASTPDVTNLTPLPVTKLLLHAIQNPHASVSGILLGKFITSTTLSIRDVLPVCHSHPTKPILDMSFRLAEAASSDDVSIVGWYTCNERAEDNAASSASHRIAHSIGERYPDREPILLVLDNIALGEYLIGEENASPFLVYGKDGRSQLLTREVNVLLDEGVASGRQLLECDKTVWDFESHLDSTGKKETMERDWMENREVVSFLDRCAVN